MVRKTGTNTTASFGMRAAALFFFVLLLSGMAGTVQAAPFTFGDMLTGGADTTSMFSDVGDGLLTAFKWLIYGVFSFCGLLVGAAMTIFGLLTRPELFQVLNGSGIYQMWQFIRDFFNLFFILTLLYIAFTIIFQVAKDYKKALLNLVIMALLVNFSFPISRFLIDAGNVPMYFFASQISDRGPAVGMAAIFSSTKLQNILIRGKAGDTEVTFDDVKGGEVTRLIAATVFLFLLAITLLVLAVMFIIRFAVLVILVIFSPVGFAGTVIPGMQKYASQWWESFTQYVVYGPAAMLMVLVAIRFFSALSAESGFEVLVQESASATNVGGMTGFISSVATFSIPIVVLWIAIGLSNKMSMFGSAAVVGAGLGAVAWTKKKAIGGAKWAAYRNPVARGVGSGVKDRFNSTWLGKTLKSPSWTEAAAKGAVLKGKGTIQGELDGRHKKMVADRVAEDKKNGVSNSAHRENLKTMSNDPVTREASALALASEKELRSSEDLLLAAQVLAKNPDGLIKAIENARPETVGKMDQKTYGEMLKSVSANPDAVAALDGRMKKEGNIKVKMDYEIAAAGGDGQKIAGVYEKNLGMNADDFAKQGSIHEAIGKDAGLTEYLKKRVGDDKDFYQEALKKMKTGEGREKMRTLVGAGSSQGSAGVRDKMKQVKSENAR